MRGWARDSTKTIEGGASFKILNPRCISGLSDVLLAEQCRIDHRSPEIRRGTHLHSRVSRLIASRFVKSFNFEHGHNKF